MPNDFQQSVLSGLNAREAIAQQTAAEAMGGNRATLSDPLANYYLQNSILQQEQFRKQQAQEDLTNNVKSMRDAMSLMATKELPDALKVQAWNEYARLRKKTDTESNIEEISGIPEGWTKKISTYANNILKVYNNPQLSEQVKAMAIMQLEAKAMDEAGEVFDAQTFLRPLIAAKEKESQQKSEQAMPEFYQELQSLVNLPQYKNKDNTINIGKIVPDLSNFVNKWSATIPVGIGGKAANSYLDEINQSVQSSQENALRQEQSGIRQEELDLSRQRLRSEEQQMQERTRLSEQNLQQRQTEAEARVARSYLNAKSKMVESNGVKYQFNPETGRYKFFDINRRVLPETAVEKLTIFGLIQQLAQEVKALYRPEWAGLFDQFKTKTQLIF